MYQVIQTFSSFNWTGLPTLVIFAPAIFSLTSRPQTQTQHPSVSCPPGAAVVAGAEALLRLTAYPLAPNLDKHSWFLWENMCH